MFVVVQKSIIVRLEKISTYMNFFCALLDISVWLINMAFLIHNLLFHQFLLQHYKLYKDILIQIMNLIFNIHLLLYQHYYINIITLHFSLQIIALFQQEYETYHIKVIEIFFMST